MNKQFKENLAAIRRELASHQLEPLPVHGSVTGYYLRPPDGGRMQSTLILFAPEGIVIMGDLCPNLHGAISCMGYGVGWFSGKLSDSYLCEKFLRQTWISELAKEGLTDRKWLKGCDYNDEQCDAFEDLADDLDDHGGEWLYDELNDAPDRPSHIYGNQQSSVGRRADGTPKPPYFNGNGARKAMLAAGELPEGASATARHSFKREHTKSLVDGTDEIQVYIPPVKANPGNVVNVKVGGGQLGHPYAHINEAPFPVELASWFIRSHCPPAGVVLDCFGGSGTTAHAADNLGRHCITSDLRMSECLLTRRRLSTPYAKRSRPAKVVKGEMTLFGREVSC